MTEKFSLECAACSTMHDASYEGRRCRACDAPLLVRFELEDTSLPTEPELPGLWRFFPTLPVLDRAAIVSLGEGNTPLVRSGRLGERLGLGELSFKDESRNPTGSFKDRMLAVGIARARELGKHTVCVQSSGNVAAAAAAYAAKAGLEAKIFVPRTVPGEKTIQIQMYGAELFRIDDDSPSVVFELMDAAAEKLGWYVVSTTARYNPFTLEGAKTIAYELAEQTRFDLPDWLLVPVGGGGNLGTLWRAFVELKALRLVSALPRLVGIQAAGCAPFVEAVREKRSWQRAASERWPKIETLCGAIADDVVFDAHIALPAVRESGGLAVSVTDEETLEAEQLLASSEGLFVEPSCATTVAALRKLVAEGTIDGTSSVCCLLTGTGLKDLGAARRLLPPPELIPPTRDAVLSKAGD